MILKLTKEYKSLQPFISDCLSDFSVITGKNGSGKSQIVQLISSLRNSNSNAHFSIDTRFDRIQIGGLQGSNLNPLDQTTWYKRINGLFDVFEKTPPATKLILGELYNLPNWTDYDQINITRLLGPDICREIKIAEILPKMANELSQGRSNFNNILEIENFLKTQNFKTQHQSFQLAKHIAEHHKISISEVNKTHIKETPIPEHIFDNTSLFESKLESIFYNYARRREINSYSFFRKERYQIRNSAISESEFTSQFPTPWSTINEILKTLDFGYLFDGVTQTNFSSEATINFNLIKTDIKKPIALNQLSSGEQVILGLIIKLFTSEYYSEHLKFPDLLVLDEPDAHLHPEMTKLLIDVLNNSFVKNLGIKVIIVTHSPSTVALAPEESVFKMTNQEKTALVKIEKREALEILTSNIPTLSIDYECHKQIFVESPTDVYYYQKIFDRLNQDKKYVNKLYFISNGFGKGNCDQVLETVGRLQEFGSSNVFGIIDWDNKNAPEKHVFVHGERSRYSIENYLYDPLYLAILMLKMNSQNIRKELGFDETFNEYQVSDLENSELQTIVDWVFEKMTVKLFKFDDSRDIVEYMNGISLSYPTSYIKWQGHDLAERLKTVFPSFEKFQNEKELQKELTKIIVKSYPLVPSDSVQLIEKLTQSQT